MTIKKTEMSFYSFWLQLVSIWNASEFITKIIETLFPLLFQSHPTTLLVRKMSTAVPVPFEDIYDFKHISGISEIDHVITKWFVAQTFNQF